VQNYVPAQNLFCSPELVKGWVRGKQKKNRRQHLTPTKTWSFAALNWSKGGSGAKKKQTFKKKQKSFHANPISHKNVLFCCYEPLLQHKGQKKFLDCVVFFVSFF
jgi:hypothetical protein|tara:strand:+ start:75 stop:389 length:315 start_codon:yes stop_codon:yes gene_type:complete